jgi:hypothetical protein
MSHVSGLFWTKVMDFLALAYLPLLIREVSCRFLKTQVCTRARNFKRRQ